MQPGTNPENIHTILGRFNHWAGDETRNGNGHAKGLKSLDAGMREIPYEEAVRLVRNRKAGSASASVKQAEAAAQKIASAGETVAEGGSASPRRTPTAKSLEEKPAATAGPADSLTGTPRKTATRERTNTTIAAGSAGKADKALRGPQRALKTAIQVKAASAQGISPPPPPRRDISGRAAKGERPPEFRRVLAKTVHESRQAASRVAADEKGRHQRVSVRLSADEEQRLQASAAKAGVTVSEYLRMRALETETPAASIAYAASADLPVDPASQTALQTVKQPRSGLGDWIALLRTRFLASPARFGERA